MYRVYRDKKTEGRKSNQAESTQRNQGTAFIHTKPASQPASQLSSARTAHADTLPTRTHLRETFPPYAHTHRRRRHGHRRTPAPPSNTRHLTPNTHQPIYVQRVIISAAHVVSPGWPGWQCRQDEARIPVLVRHNCRCRPVLPNQHTHTRTASCNSGPASLVARQTRRLLPRLLLRQTATHGPHMRPSWRCGSQHLGSVGTASRDSVLYAYCRCCVAVSEGSSGMLWLGWDA
jgi:hypothetical protein